MPIVKEMENLTLTRPLTDQEIDYYTAKITNRFLLAYGEDYENFVGDVLSRCYPGDFIGVSSGGGDQKNDGIVRSLRHLYQCYGPAKHSIANLNKKIKQDYEGAVKNWGGHFDVWRFSYCHSKNDGLNAKTVKLILDLELKHGKRIEILRLSEMLQLAMSMPRESLVQWIGPPAAPAESLAHDLRLSVIGTVVKALASSGIPVDDLDNLDPVPPTKLVYNRIPRSVQAYIEAGKALSNRVTKYVNTSPDPLLVEQMAVIFRQEYRIIRSQTPDSPETIYWRLYSLISNKLGETISQEEDTAAHAVLSYLFHRCDIFDRPPPGWTGH
ncbi:ABC-three component system protein [Deinococcus sp. RIT780]|uniref:ABC-three component system protein n=1 Tax=Deinococcus sp. RIT780 TaxID=2870472 RepID=UPI001C890EE3|nr:ABC-three component system protein [Deinococcus sp. RIT780]MBX8464323.1 hypothetical protein [Deinococcus sp. RIT780]